MFLFLLAILMLFVKKKNRLDCFDIKDELYLMNYELVTKKLVAIQFIIFKIHINLLGVPKYKSE